MINQDDQSKVILVEEWQSKGKYEAYNAWRKNKGDFNLLEGFLAEPLTRQFLNKLAL